MCRAVETLVKENRMEAHKEGREEGREEGRMDERIDTIRALMENMKWSAEQAMRAMAIPEAEWSKYKELLANTEK